MLWSWIADEWITLQTRGTPWKFLRETRTLPTVASQQTYAASAMGGSFYMLWPSSGDYRARAIDGSAWWWMSPEVDYDKLRREFIPGHAPGAPVKYAATPSGGVILGPTPDRVMSIEFDVMRAPQALAEPADEPDGLPAHHRLILVWGALKRLAVDDAAGELLQRANQEWDTAFSRLWIDQGPPMEFGVG